ncbi:hypothetical protein BD779DRAFT_1150133 [Infundibulicybe gibba]|nr:hypothetical protein BD779DRAFT_1150133 [Infundibulicybe gibba]
MLPQNAQLIPPWLSQRYTAQRLWYDDYVALFVVIMDCVYFVALHIWTRSVPNGTTFGKETSITFYWIGATCFFLISWLAKASLALAIARIFSPKRTIRRFAIGMAWSFGLMGIVLLLGMLISCGRDTSWHDSPEVQCDFPKALIITIFCTGLISDTLLVFIPLRTLWKARLPDEQRRFVLVGFAASAWTVIAGGIFFAFTFEPNSWELPHKTALHLLGHASASVCLMVCNSMVIVAYIYRLFRSDKDLEYSISEAASNGNGMPPHTTIALTNPKGLNDPSQNLHRRGIPRNGYSFSEGALVEFSPSSSFTTSRTIPQTSGSA